MKNILLLSLLLAALGSSLRAQPSFPFDATLNGASEVPPNNSTATGTGSFTLDNDLFTYQIFSPLPFFPIGARIHGPAPAGVPADPIFDLSGPVFVGPGTMGEPGGYSFTGNRSLNGTEIGQLFAGQWYINVRSAAFPEGEIRGQIVPVPEPTTLALERS